MAQEPARRWPISAWKACALLSCAAAATMLILASLGGSAVVPSDASFTTDSPAPAKAAGGRQTVPGDPPLLMARNCIGVEFVRDQVGNDCRNAAAVSADGFLWLRVASPGATALRFAAAARGSVSHLAARITLVSAARAQTVVWQKPLSELSKDKWLELSLPLPRGFQGEALFEVTGRGSGKALFAAPRVVAPDASRPNIILVVADALRPDRLGVYGSQLNLTPGLDRLARRATVFERCQAQAPWTIPSMGSLLTSLYPAAHGMVSYRVGLGASLDTLAEALSRSGYSTVCFQTNYNLTPDKGLAQGFDEYILGPLVPVKPWMPGKPIAYPYWRAEQVCSRATYAFKRHEGEPLFLYMHFMDTHSPYMPPKSFDTFGRDDKGRYNGSAAYFSDCFTSFMDDLDRQGLLANTIVVLTADHGEQFLEHGSTGHGNGLYAEELMVPLVVWRPGARGGARVPALVRSIDIAPTLVELAHARPLAEAAGESFAAAFDNPDALSDRPAYAELESLKVPDQVQVSCFDGRFRLIVTDPDSKWKRHVQLYDVIEDPREYVNLAADRGDSLAPLLADVMGFLPAGRMLNRRLVPTDVAVPLSPERIEALKALGYISPSSR